MGRNPGSSWDLSLSSQSGGVLCLDAAQTGGCQSKDEKKGMMLIPLAIPLRSTSHLQVPAATLQGLGHIVNLSSSREGK